MEFIIRKKKKKEEMQASSCSVSGLTFCFFSSRTHRYRAYLFFLLSVGSSSMIRMPTSVLSLCLVDIRYKINEFLLFCFFKHSASASVKNGRTSFPPTSSTASAATVFCSNVQCTVHIDPSTSSPTSSASPNNNNNYQHNHDSVGSVNRNSCMVASMDDSGNAWERFTMVLSRWCWCKITHPTWTYWYPSLVI